MFVKLFTATGNAANRPASIEAQLNAYLLANPHVAVMSIIQLDGAGSVLYVLVVCVVWG